MENQQQGVEVKKQTDYWKLAYKNFFQLSILGFLIFLAYIYMYATKSGPYQSITILAIIVVLVTTILWFTVSQLFKKNNKMAITVSYIMLAIETVLLILSQSGLIVLLVLGYLFWITYKASKTPLVLASQ